MTVEQSELQEKVEEFTKYVRLYSQLVPDYDIDVECRAFPPDDNSVAECHIEDTRATIGMNLNDVPSSLRRAAFHEVCHVMLHDLEIKAKSTYSDSIIDKLIENIIIRLEKVIPA